MTGGSEPEEEGDDTLVLLGTGTGLCILQTLCDLVAGATTT